MHETLIQSINNILKDFKSTKQMLKGNRDIFKLLGYSHIPEMQTAFCHGIVYDQIVRRVDDYCFPNEPPEDIMMHTQKMFYDFILGKYDY